MSSVKVEIKLGKHSMKIPNGMEKLIEKLIEKAGYSGTFEAKLGANVKGTSHTKPIKIIGMSKSTGTINLKVKPDSNDSCHEIRLKVPKDKRIKELYQNLLRANGQYPPKQIASLSSKRKGKKSKKSKNSTDKGLVDSMLEDLILSLILIQENADKSDFISHRKLGQIKSEFKPDIEKLLKHGFLEKKLIDGIVTGYNLTQKAKDNIGENSLEDIENDNGQQQNKRILTQVEVLENTMQQIVAGERRIVEIDRKIENLEKEKRELIDWLKSPETITVVEKYKQIQKIMQH